MISGIIRSILLLLAAVAFIAVSIFGVFHFAAEAEMQALNPYGERATYIRYDYANYEYVEYDANTHDRLTPRNPRLTKEPIHEPPTP